MELPCILLVSYVVRISRYLFYLSKQNVAILAQIQGSEQAIFNPLHVPDFLEFSCFI